MDYYKVLRTSPVSVAVIAIFMFEEDAREYIEASKKRESPAVTFQVISGPINTRTELGAL